MPRDLGTLYAMFRAYPGRSAVLSGLPLAVAGGQSVNAVLNGLSSPLVIAFVLGLVAVALAATRHSMLVFRTERLEQRFLER